MSDSERSQANIIRLILLTGPTMKILRARIEKKPDGTYQISMLVRDDAGNIFPAYTGVKTGSDIPAALQGTLRSLSVVTAQVTEEENFNPKA